MKDASLAGFDGFHSNANDYYDTKYAFVGNEEYNVATNELTSKGIKALSKEIRIHFITESLYDSDRD